MSESASGEAKSSTDTSDKELSCGACGKTYSSSSALRYHLRRCSPELMESCPTCGDGFLNKYGMKKHHKLAHGDSLHLQEHICDYCGTEYEAPEDSRWCSMDCKADWQSANLTGENSPSWNGGKVKTECETCGATVERKQNEYERYENHFCSQDCRAEHHASVFVGSDHPNWKENIPDRHFYRTAKWKRTREKALERDNYECQVCGTGSKLHVHHIIPAGEGGPKYDVDNTVTLCNSHHNTWEGLYLRPDTRHVD